MSKRKGKKLESADDWLNEGISLEESGDRWLQAPEKAHRFYKQAITAYESALRLQPDLKDAEFNRARLFLQIAQNCALLFNEKLEVLEQARTAHERISSVDAQYNLACVLLLIVETLTEHEHDLDVALEPLVKRSLELLEQCRVHQVQELAKLNSEESDDGIAEEGDVEVTYISKDILLDTIITMLEAYAQLLSLETDVQSREVAHQLIQSALPSEDPHIDRFDAAMYAVTLNELEYAYKVGSISLDQWRAGLQTSSESVAIMCLNTDACIALAAVDSASAWATLNVASTQIAKAIQLSQKAPQLWITRGDVEMLRSNVDHDSARKNKVTLMNNAGIYYKRAVAESLPKDIRLRNEAALKHAVIEAEIKTTPQVPEMTATEAKQIIRDARSDGVFIGNFKLLS